MKTTFTITALIFCFFNLSAQQFATTENGQKVKLNDDGTWEIVEEATKVDESIEELANKINTSDCKLTKNEVDDFTGKVNKTHKTEKLGKSLAGFVFCYAVQIDDTYALLMYNSLDASCVSSDTKVSFKFTDGTVLELQHSGSINCGAYAAFVLDVTYHLDELLSKPIEKVRLSYTERIIDSELTDQTAIQEQLACLVKG